MAVSRAVGRLTNPPEVREGVDAARLLLEHKHPVRSRRSSDSLYAEPSGFMN